MNRTNPQSGSEQGTDRAAAYASADVLLDTSCDEPALGAHLITQRRGYEHHGIYAGHGMVIHYAGFAKSAHRGPVEEVSLHQFADGHELAVRPHPFPKFSGEETVRRARTRLGENCYRLLTNNCEHFCAWCLLGESRSEQVHTCLTHPRAGVRALLCLASAFVENRMSFGRTVVDAM